MNSAFTRACGRPHCSYTITPDEQRLSFGCGDCNSQGEWEYPCHTCAAAAQADMQQVIDNTRLELLARGNSIDMVDKYMLSQGWMHNPVWPFVGVEASEVATSLVLN